MFDALDICLDPVLRLPVGGVEVAVPFPTIRDGLRYKRWYADLLAGHPVDDLDPVALFLPDPLPDGVTDEDARRCAWTALAWFGIGPKAGMRVWTDQAPDEAAHEPEPTLLDGPWGAYDPRPGALGPDDPGGGPYDPELGIRRWYNETGPNPRALSVTWADLLQRWDAVVCDFQQHYHLELDALLDCRHIGWLEARIAGLQEIPGSRIQTITALSKES